MRRPAIITITTIGAAAAATAALTTTSPAQPAGPPTGELHLVARAQSVTLVDNPPRQHSRHHPPSRGDGLVLLALQASRLVLERPRVFRLGP